MKIISTCGQLRRWLFQYPQKIQTSIHNSLTNKTALLAVRIIALLILSYRYVLSILIYDSAFIMVEYLTELGYLFTWTYFVLTCQDYLLNERRQQKISKQLGDWIGLLFEITICMEVVITILFWSVLYNYSKPFEVLQFLKEVGVHGFPFVCLLMDLMLNTYQFPKRHLPIVLLFGDLYLGINIGFSLSVSPVYKPLDWVSLMCYVYVVVCHLIVIGFHTLIRKSWQKHRRPKLVELLKVDTENYFNFDGKCINN